MCYEACRELKLAGERENERSGGPSQHVATVVLACGHERHPLPWDVVMRIAALRFLMSVFAIQMGVFYVYFALVLDWLPELWESDWSKSATVAAMIPYSIISFYLSRDMIRSLTRKQLCAALTMGVMIIMASGVAINHVALYIFEPPNDYKFRWSLEIYGIKNY